jgi:CheY-like chemotaxis protein
MIDEGAMLSVLVIDDDDAIVRLLTLTLTRAGLRVSIAANGNDGLSQLKAGPFDVVVTGIRMPQLDGNRLADLVRRTVVPQPVIIGMSGTPRQACSGLFDTVISKPFSIHTLLNTIIHLAGDRLHQCQSTTDAGRDTPAAHQLSFG